MLLSGHVLFVSKANGFSCSGVGRQTAIIGVDLGVNEGGDKSNGGSAWHVAQ